MTALITGAARRLGRDMALKLSEMGYQLALHYHRSFDLAKELAERISTRSALFQADLSIDEELFALIRQVKEEFDDLTLLVNNASVFERASLKETDLELFNRNFSINFKAAYFLSRDFARLCQKGQIIQILDSKIATNDIHYSAYTLSKKALGAFTQISAKELAPDIRVNGIAPGYILPPEGESPKYLKKRPETIPLRKQGNPNNITQALEFLLTNPFVTGQILFVDGGDHL